MLSGILLLLVASVYGNIFMCRLITDGEFRSYWTRRKESK